MNFFELKNQSDFELAHIFECGQCFRWNKNDDGSYAYSDDGSQIMIQDDKIEECNDELEKLMGLEIQVDNLDFSIDNFGADIECTPDELEKLAPFLN